ncbi:hypothetical protein [Geomonas subterranea]|uniref:hypothetical protein n=1 Tax=Geomonas subterranea TaxID=2847989 RepID=UPI001CD2FA0A|nr:hypothetical protein [Geomonas fuzhouensis]
MTKNVPLKTQNIPVFSLFIGWCSTLYVMFLSTPPASINRLSSILASVTSKESLLVALGPIIILVVSGILSPQVKASLVYWRISHALPGHRAFSVYCKKDTRIDLKALEKKIGSFPVDQDDQNRQWYRLYKENSEKTIVINSHRNFLLSRDLAGASALATVILPLSLLLFTKFFWSTVGLFSILLTQYLIITLVARNHGERFVCNVLVEAAVTAGNFNKVPQRGRAGTVDSRNRSDSQPDTP